MQMMEQSRVGIRRAAALVAIALVALAGSLAFGAGVLTTGAQSSSDIYGCVNSYTGALRIINANSKCSTGERPLNWSKLPAGTVLDRQQVGDSERVVTADEQATALVRVGCPLGYQVVTGGASSFRYSGTDRFYLKRAEPVYNGVDNPQGWAAEFETVDGQFAEGEYEFAVTALCELRSK